MRFLKYVIGFAAGVAVTPLLSAAPIDISTADGLGADVFVQSTSGNTAPFANFNNSGLTVKNGAAADGFARKAYLRFDLAALSGQTAIDAVLSLTVSTITADTAFTVQVLALVDGFAGSDAAISGTANGSLDNDEDIHNEFWPEGTIDWDSAPANDTGSGSAFTSDAILLGSVAIPNTTVVNDTVTFSNQNLVNAINGDTNGVITLMLRRSGTNAGGSANLAFTSAEAVTTDKLNDPTLSVTIPEPTALFAVAAMLPLFRRRRRV